MENVIAITCFDRPTHLDRLLSSILAAKNNEFWMLVISVEPSEQVEVVERVISHYSDKLSIVYRVNETRKGVRQNPYDNIEWVIERGAKLIFLLEDDLVIDPLALKWCENLSQSELKSPNVMCANLLMTTCSSESIFVPAPSEWKILADVVLKTRFFSSLGLLFSVQQWTQYFKNNWFCDLPEMENWIGDRLIGWDMAMNRYLLTSENLVVLQSLVPRVTHDGAGGTHVTDEFQSQSFDNIKLDFDGIYNFDRLRVVDPLTDLTVVKSSSARMFINLSRHLWTLQQSSLRLKHHFSGLSLKKSQQFKLGNYWLMLLPGRKLKK